MRINTVSLLSPSRSALSAALMFAALAATAANAQDSVADEEPAAEDQAQQIVVTGSRIATDTTTALASPVQVVTLEQFTKAGEIDITQTLREIPALQGSDPATLDSAQGFATTGASTLDLRQLGTDRTLVLQDGRRHVPGIAGTATVDVNAIPQALISRVEVLTGGASAVYGADAVSGVVNFVTRTGRDFDGLEYRVQTGISDKGDAEEFFGSIAGGGTFNDGRGSAVFAVEYQRSGEVLNRDRPNFAGPGLTVFSQSNEFLSTLLGLNPNAENVLIRNPTLPVSSAGGTIAIDPTPFACPFCALESYVTNFNPATGTVPTIPGTNIPVLQIIDPSTGQLRAFNPGVSIDPFTASGGDGIFTGGNAPNNTLIPQIKRFVASAGADYEVTDNLTFFVDAKFHYVETSDTGGIPFSDDIPIALDNAFIPPALAAQIPIVDALRPTRTPSIVMARDNVGSDVGRGDDVERSTIRASGGLRYDAQDSNLTVEASYTWGRTDVTRTLRNRRLNDRYFTALDAVALTADNISGASPIFNFTSGRNSLKAVRNGQDITINRETARAGDIVCRSEVTGVPAPSNFVNLGGGAFVIVGGPPIYTPGSNTVIRGVTVDERTRPVTFQIGDGTCAPVNIFGASAIQGAGLNFAFEDLEQKTVIEQQQFLATMAGDTANFLELPGGPIGFAAGFEWRRDQSQFTRDSFETIEGRVIENVNFPLFDAPLNGEGITVYEAFGEIRVPLLGDMPFVEKLEVSASGRYSDYNTIGTTETYSFGGIYAPTDWLSFRGTYSRAVRAPNIGELFNPQSIATIGVNADPCDDGNINNGSSNRVENCREFVAPGFNSAAFLTSFSTGFTGGNPNLTEETADSFTVGGIFQPKGILGGALDNLVVIVDYYDIEITDAIGALTGAQVAAACVDLPSIDNQFCDQVTRDPARGNAIVGFNSPNINFSELRARGIDFEARYSFDAPFGNGNWGTFQIGAAGTRFLERSTQSDPVIQQVIDAETDPLQKQLLIVDQGTVSDLLGVVGNPEWIVNFNANWQINNFNIGWRGRFEDSALTFSNSANTDVEIVNGAVVVSLNEDLVDASQRFTGSSFEHDINFTMEVNETLNVYGGVNNLTDREPFLGSLIRPVSPRGRFFFLGVQGKF
jgi:outer membrane receptor protein involved in Fe transport